MKNMPGVKKWFKNEASKYDNDQLLIEQNSLTPDIVFQDLDLKECYQYTDTTRTEVADFAAFQYYDVKMRSGDKIRIRAFSVEQIDKALEEEGILPVREPTGFLPWVRTTPSDLDEECMNDEL